MVRATSAPVVAVQGVVPAQVVGSCPLASVSKDQLTPAIAVLSESFKEGDFDIDCEGCTACCRGHDGVKVDLGEEALYDTVKDDHGEWRLRNVDGKCVYLDEKGGTIHANRQPAHHHTEMDGRPVVVLDEEMPLKLQPRRCREFDCRAAIIFYNNVGIDELVRTSKLPLDVVTMGRKKLAEFNNLMNLRATSGGADLSFLMEGDSGQPAPKD